MNNTAHLSVRRKRRGRKAKSGRAALLFCLLALLGFVFVMARACTKPDPTADASRIIAIESKKAVLRGADGKTVHALSEVMTKQLGKPYIYGAAGPDAFDCSGLVQYVYASLGIELPRVVRAQAKAGVTIQKEDLAFGDLVCFSDGSAALTHIGIYLGDGYFIHAPSTGQCVQLGDLDSEYYSAVFRLAVRVLE
jgi:cell wall-associated NlpC family hydrolase